MLVTLIPLFDENIKVSAYSLYTQKANFLLHPNLLGSGSNDGAAQIEGFELILNMGLETLSPAKEIFVPALWHFRKFLFHIFNIHTQLSIP